MEQTLHYAEAGRNSLKTGFDKYVLINILEYKSLVHTTNKKGVLIEIWTKAFQTAIDENERIYIPEGIYYIDQSLVLPSNREIIADPNAKICLISGVKVLLMRNKDVVDGSYRVIAEEEPRTENIRIEGGIWMEENVRRLGYGKSGTFDESHSLVGVSTCLLFSGVKNLSLSHMKFRNTAGFAIQIGRCENFYISDIIFEDCFADGIHINGDTKNGVVSDISGQTGDDLVALNMYDWEDSTINNGLLENVVVKNIFAVSDSEYKAFRIQPGILPIEGGEIDCYIKNLFIQNVRGVSVFKMYLQTPKYTDKPDGARVGHMENVVFENIEMYLNQNVDALDNYLNHDPVTGHYGAFEIGSNIKSLSLKNIKAVINKAEHPTAHLISIGPKSSYDAESNVEIFDPYVKCEVEQILYDCVEVNGRNVENLSEEIHEVKFENLYSGVYGDGIGYGRVRDIWDKKDKGSQKGGK